jgi:hypothetical protein
MSWRALGLGLAGCEPPPRLRPPSAHVNPSPTAGPSPTRQWAILQSSAEISSGESPLVCGHVPRTELPADFSAPLPGHVSRIDGFLGQDESPVIDHHFHTGVLPHALEAEVPVPPHDSGFRRGVGRAPSVAVPGSASFIDWIQVPASTPTWRARVRRVSCKSLTTSAAGFDTRCCTQPHGDCMIRALGPARASYLKTHSISAEPSPKWPVGSSLFQEGWNMSRRLRRVPPRRYAFPGVAQRWSTPATTRAVTGGIAL